MTYLEIVNKVLIRLREDTVSTVGQTTYSALIGEFVNDAFRMCEDAWDWSALRTTLTVTTTADIFNYVLTGSGNRIKLIDVLNEEGNYFLTKKDPIWFDARFLNSNPASGSPYFFTFNGVDANGDTAVDIYPIPDGIYNIYFNCILRSAELEADADTVSIPTLPVIQAATAMALRERGETGGASAAEAFAIADRSLGDAIALDAYKHPEDTCYYPV